MAQVIIPGIDRTITIGSASFSGTGDDDATSGGTYTGTNRSIYTIEIESEDFLGNATADSDNTGTDDATSSGTYTDNQNSTYTLEIDGVDIGEATADSGNSGNDDLTTGGTYVESNPAYAGTWTAMIEAVESGSISAFTDAGGGQVTVASAGHGLSNGEDIVLSNTVNYDGAYTISNVATNAYEITATYIADDATGRWEKVNTFKWVKGSGNYTTGVAVTGSAQSLEDGVNVTFGATTGHIEDDYWEFDVLKEDTFKWKKNDGSYTEGVLISPTNSSISAYADAGGGQVTVTSNAHGLEDDDEITISGTTNYNGTFVISNKTSNTFEITDTWVADDATGSWVRDKKILSDGVSAEFTNNKVHDLGDIWTITAKPDNFKWNENDGTETTGVAITKAAQTLNSGVTVTFTDNDNHTLGDKWTITVQGDISIDRSQTDDELVHYVSPAEYEVDTLSLEMLNYNLRTGALTISGYKSDGSTFTVSAGSELAATLSAIITSEQSDLSTDLTEQDPGLPDTPNMY